MIEENKYHINYATAGKSLFDFEEEKHLELKKINSKNWNAWRILKTPLFFYIIYREHPSKEPNSKRKKAFIIVKAIKIFFTLFLTFLKLIKIYLYNIQKKDLVIFVTLSANKTLIDKDGKAHDVIVDYFIEKKIVNNYIYIEIPDNFGRSLLKSAVKSNFIASEFLIFYRILYKIIHRREFIKTPSKEITNLFNNHFKKFNISIEASLTKNLLTEFWVDYCVFLFIFRVFKPKLVVFNDQFATGRMAAAKKMKIKTIELQHGLMDEYYPQYLLNPKFREIIDNLPIADIIGVFGEFHKKQLLNKGFFNESQIFVLGKFDIANTAPKIQRFSSKKTILFISQGTLLFEQTVKDLTQLLELIDLNQYFIILKLHPLEPAELVLQYQQLCLGHVENVKIIQKELSALELIPVCDVVLGYNSTVLLESAAKKKAVFSLSDGVCAKGIFSIIGEDDELRKSIKNSADVGDFVKSISDAFYDSYDVGSYLFSPDYLKNSKKIFNEALGS